MPIENRGTIIRQGNVMQVSNAFVEEVSLRNNTTGFILISYAERSSAGVTFINELRLNVSRTTTIFDMSGRTVCLCDIRRGMWIDAVFSSIMTRSIPPQSNAFLILVRRPVPTPPPGRPPIPGPGPGRPPIPGPGPGRPPIPGPGPGRPPAPGPSNTFTGRIISVDANTNSFLTGNPNNPNRQNRFIVTSNTIIRNRQGNPIRFFNLRPGQMVRIIHADFLTTSIPPQTTAFYVQVI